MYCSANTYGQHVLRTDVCPSIGFNFKTKTLGLLKRNSLDIGLGAFFRWERPSSSQNYNFLISLSYPLQNIDSNKTSIFLSLMPGIRKEIKKVNFFYANAGIVGNLGLTEIGYGIKIGYARLIANSNQIGLTFGYSSLGFLNCQAVYLLTLKSKY